MNVFKETFVLLILSLVAELTTCMPHRDEGHSIMKRMADGGQQFEGHDVARVHLVDGRGQQGKRLVKRDLRDTLDNRATPATTTTDGSAKELQLALASGSRVNLTLTRASIVDSDTAVAFHTARGRIRRNSTEWDCYSHGQAVDSSGEGWAVVSHCNGLFGVLMSTDFEYFLHPVESSRSKRDADGDYDVHVLWRRSPSEDGDVIADDATQGNGDGGTDEDLVEDTNDDVTNPEDQVERQTRSVDSPEYPKVVVEMAMFSDQQYWEKLQYLYPGREEDFLLIRMAGVQMLYGKPDKIGFDIRIKLKYIEFWKTNPDGYIFQDQITKNLNSFITYARSRYRYDVVGLNTGVSLSSYGIVGMARSGSACTRRSCFVAKKTDLASFVLIAHEIGHVLGMPHASKKCIPISGSKALKGFVGGGNRFHFSPCMKEILGEFLRHKSSQCLYEESSITNTKAEFSDLPNLFPGQERDPNALCEVLAGPGYSYVPFGKSMGVSMCLWFVCLNGDQTSPEFGRTKRFPAPDGFPCGSESYCLNGNKCVPWNIAIDYSTLISQNPPPKWSEWSADFSECSRSCGTGMKTRRRQCLFSDHNLSPYCPGMAFDAETCNTDPCPDDPTELAELRQTRGDEVCQRFHDNDVRLKLKNAESYLPTYSRVATKDMMVNIWVSHSPNCMVKCTRVPSSVKGELDAFLPDGTPCSDAHRTLDEIEELGISMRCVRGFCLEFPQ